METADVVVVGAGVNGASTAFHLAKAGAGKVVVLERRFPGAGASGKSGALVRTHYTNRPETELAAESMRYFHNWADMVGGDCGFQRVGLMIFTPPEQLDNLRHNVAMHRELGANAQLLTPAEAQTLDPALAFDDVTHVAYEPDSGYADANATTYAFVEAAQALGVEFRYETEVTAVTHEAGKVTGVQTAQGTIAAPTVVVIAGAWANHLFTPLGIDLGLKPTAVRVAVFRWAMTRPPQHLTYIDHINHTWIRPIDGTSTLIGTELASTEGVDPNNYSESVPQEYIDLCREKLAKRIPVMHSANMRGNWTCVLMRSPDSRPIIDQLAGYDGLFTMAGDSGTSFKTAPAIGKCLAEWITEGCAKTVDLTPFRASRFAEGKPWHDVHSYASGAVTVSR